MKGLEVAILLATANKALLDLIAAPIRKRYPELDLWWFDWVSLVTGGVLAWFAGVNVLGSMAIDPLIGRILTALLVGGGANLLNQILGLVPLSTIPMLGAAKREARWENGTRPHGRPRRGW